MHYHQSYDDEEFEPRSIPKPITKLDCFAVPTVPEVSLIFEKPRVRNSNDGCNNSPPVKLLEPIRVLDNIDKPVERINSTSPILRNPNSYAAWREQNYTHEPNSRNAIDVSPICKNTHSCNHALQSDVSIQKLQEQDKICNMQRREVNVRSNDRIYEKCVKFACSDVDNSCNRGETYLSPTNKRFLPCNSLQKTMISKPDHNTRMSNNGIPDISKRTEHLQMPYAEYQQQFHPSNYSNNNIDNNETVRTLLQLVNSQSEQIKNLQLQIDRLVRMQEENFRNKSTCSCSSALANQALKYPSINCYDTVLSSSLAPYQNKDVKKNESIQNTSAIEKQDLKMVDGDNNKLETALLEQQSKKTFVEQKVSIGVMTSFEFTVQNNPFLLDSEIYEKKEISRENNNINKRNTVNVHDTAEPVTRYKNTLTRKTGAAQLENIVEDSESYLSSNQQQSSNFNVSSVRDSERQTLKESDIYNAGNISESSKVYQYPVIGLNQKEIHREVCTEENNNTNKQMQDTRKMFNASMNVEYSPRESMNCSKMHSNENDYTTINREKNTANMHATHSSHNTHLPTADYYQNHRSKERGINGKQIKEIGDSLILSGGDFKIPERPPPTPEPSIHVEMQEYMSDDDESDTLKHTPKIGWTFYNNVLGQVNEILQNSSVIDDKNQNNAKIVRKVEQENDMETKTALNTVKAATLEQLRRLGISLTENNEYRESNSNKTLDFDSSFYPRLDYQANMIHTTSVVNETNTSMHMKALALKYLSDEQLADIALHKQESSSLKHLMLSNMQGTNMSLATMRYLERYKILPGKNNVPMENTDKTYGEVAPKRDFKPATRKFPFVQTPGTTCPSRILDLSTLKKQPKLL